MIDLRSAALGMALLVLATTAMAAPPTAGASAIETLTRDTGARATVHLNRATGAARFIRIEPRSLALAGTRPAEKAADFLARYGAALGVRHPALDLVAISERTDRYGYTHLVYDQVHRGVPVFAGRLKLHFDPRGELTAANGTIVPDIALDVTPYWSADDAATVAVTVATRGLARAPLAPLEARSRRLVVFREGLLAGVAGMNRLCWEIEVGNRRDVRELVFVDARTGKLVEQITLILDALERHVHEPAFDDVVVWSEGDTLPYATGDGVNDGQVNGLIDVAADVYALYSNLSGGTHLSWDGASGPLHSVWKAEALNCPNASWNGISTNFCDGVASDDVAAHEWTHAYTQATHDLIYQWQPGALNEAYSDMFGEVVDFIDGAGTDAPGGTRVPGDCSTFGGDPPTVLEITAPAAIAGSYVVGGANFNPPPPFAVSAAVALAVDGGGNPNDACGPLVGFPAGRIALADRGNCMFTVKVTNAQNAGASAVIVVNTADNAFQMTGNAPSITIPSVMVSSSDGLAIETALGSGTVQATVARAGATAASYRWLMGEDSFAFGGAIRDLWNPNCMGDPARVSDALYACGTGDGGGVHTNSGVPNHAFALLVDGGSFNGHPVAAIGLTKAAHLYWRAMTVYQVPASDFADHADALTESCLDLVGIDLDGLGSGAPSGQVISAGDCAAVAAAIAAVELEADPPCVSYPCSTRQLRRRRAGPWPSPTTSRPTRERAGRERTPGSSESTRHGTGSGRDQVPAGAGAHAFYAIDGRNIGNCVEGDDDQSGAMRLASPPIALGGSPLLVFDHYVATEHSFDGGNLKIRVNDGFWLPIDRTDFVFNAYNDNLASAANGNTNPLAGEQAFSGSDGGEVTGSWGQSQVDLSSYAGAGDVIRLRFDFGVDGCNGLDGWYLDALQACTDEAGAGGVPDGAAGSTPLEVDIDGSGDLTLTWADSCVAGDGDYAVYAGGMGSFASHVPVTCTTGGATSYSFTPTAGDVYYLVVPRTVSREGSYGRLDGRRAPAVGRGLPAASARARLSLSRRPSRVTKAMSSLLDRIGLGRPELVAWAMYDWANSAFQTTIIATLFPIYFLSVVAKGLPGTVAASRFAWATTLAILIVAVVAPLLGAVADYAGWRKRFLAIFLGIGVVSTTAMYWLTEGDWRLALGLFVIGNVGVAGSTIFYESLLPHIVANESELDRVSAAGYAIGYLGGGVLLALNLLMIERPSLFGIANREMAVRLSLASVGVWWLVFSIPLFRRVAEPARRLASDERPGAMAFVVGMRRLVETFGELRRYKQASLLLVAFLIYNDGIQTIIRMATTYGSEIGIDQSAMIAALLITQFVGVPFAFLFGHLAGRIGAKVAVAGGLVVYAGITVLGYFVQTATHFFVLAVLVGLVQGGTQALSRSLFASMIPRHKSSEFFAFFGVFERYAGILGPLLFASMIEATGSSRNAILAVLAFFIVGGALFAFVNVDAGRREAEAAEAGVLSL